MTTATQYSISDLAKEFDLTTRAIRFYEDMGLLQPERAGAAGRSRVYSTRDRTRLKLTLRAKRLGLSLTEARDIIGMYDSPRDTEAQLEKFLGVLGSHRAQLEAPLARLQPREVEQVLDEARLRLGALPDGFHGTPRLSLAEALRLEEARPQQDGAERRT